MLYSEFWLETLQCTAKYYHKFVENCIKKNKKLWFSEAILNLYPSLFLGIKFYFFHTSKNEISDSLVKLIYITQHISSMKSIIWFVVAQERQTGHLYMLLKTSSLRKEVICLPMVLQFNSIELGRNSAALKWLFSGFRQHSAPAHLTFCWKHSQLNHSYKQTSACSNNQDLRDLFFHKPFGWY